MIVIDEPIKISKPKKILKPQFKIILFVIIFLISIIAFWYVDNFILNKEVLGTNNSVDTNASITRNPLEAIIDKGATVIDVLIDPELKHDDNNLTSLLLVGMDTREVDFDGEKFISTGNGQGSSARNTDTVMQVIYDHNNDNIFMISIPRDIGIDVNKDCLELHGSIHKVYDLAEIYNCPEGGVQVLMDTVKSVTGFDVHYYGFVTLDGFKEIVEIIGEENDAGEKGLWIENPSTVWELYPNEQNGSWERAYFPEGRIFVNADDALKYVRSRQTTTDFGRIRRQQIFLESLKDSALKSSTILNPQKILNLLQVFREKTMFSSPDFKEISAGIGILRDFDNQNIINVVLDYDLGGWEEYLDKQPHGRRGGFYYMVPSHWRECPQEDVYCEVHKFLGNIVKHPEVYKENVSIFAYAREHKNWKPNLENELFIQLRDNRYPIKLSESKYLAKTDVQGDIIIFDYTNGNNPETVNLLSQKLNAKVYPGDQGESVRINKEDISIVVTGK